MNRTVETLLREATARLTGIGDTPRLDAELLLCHAIDRPRSWLFAWPEQILEGEAVRRFDKLVEERMRGVPIAYLVGRREFWSLDLEVTPDTLVPRPETERLVELALERLPPDSRGWVADLGTGSGAIALAIARERPALQVVGIDQSGAACRVATGNAHRLGLGNAHFVQGHWASALAPSRLLMIVSNPPYVEEGDPCLSRGDLLHEPRSALTAGRDGLTAFRTLLPSAVAALQAGGWLLVEHGEEQGRVVEALLRGAGLEEVSDHTDLTGRPRVAIGRVAASAAS